MGIHYLPRTWIHSKQRFGADSTNFETMDRNGSVFIPRPELPDALSDWLPPEEPIVIETIVSWTSQAGGQMLLTLNENTMGTEQRAEILNAIRALTGDNDIRICAVVRDEGTLVLQGSSESFAIVREAFQDGRLVDALGTEVLKLEEISGATVKMAATRASSETVSPAKEHLLFPGEPCLVASGLGARDGNSSTANVSWCHELHNGSAGLVYDEIKRCCSCPASCYVGTITLSFFHS